MITVNIKKRFCKDEKLSLQAFKDDAIFEERLEAMGKLDRWNKFKQIYKDKYNEDEQAYFEEYRKLKDSVINYIKESPAFKHLNERNMNDFVVTEFQQIRSQDVYKDINVGKEFISIDMVKANFSSFVAYGHIEMKGESLEPGKLAFFDSYDWQDFMEQFTDNEHFINSKYIRQVIFGNCNAQRVTKYEKYLMSCVLHSLLKKLNLTDEVVYNLYTDEIILDADKLTKDQIKDVYKYFEERQKYSEIPLRLEHFKLGRVLGSSAFVKKNMQPNMNTKQEITSDGTLKVKVSFTETVELKCVNPLESIFLYRLLRDERVRDNDLYFWHEGRLAKFCAVPKLRVTFTYDEVTSSYKDTDESED